jgi:CHAT domain-containing protein
MRFEPLPDSMAEIEDINDLWKKASPRLPGAGDGKTSVVTLAGPRATEAAFKAEAPGKRILHLATHGFFLGGECRSALMRRRGVGGLSSAADRKLPPPPVENPLLLSGLALAGANHRDAAGPGEEDGILTAEEIAATDLGGVEWAVLSACDTGRGEIRSGEGVLGLVRAFRVAGTGSVIMSLWPIEDQSAREWMRNLYSARLLEKQGTAQAVRTASLALLHSDWTKDRKEHPFYWAGFVATGDWK